MLFVIGAAGRGKSSICRKLAEGRTVISAGGWVREAFARPHHGAHDPCRCPRCTGEPVEPAAEAMGVYAAKRLKEDPDTAIHYVISQRLKLRASRDRCIVEGIRNPRDLMALAFPGDHILDLGGEGASEFERSGLRAIRASRDFLTSQLSITWADYTRYFATLPEPYPMHVEAAVLFGDDHEGSVPGKVIAFESYVGHPVTACWQSDDGGTFHDVPLSALYAPDYCIPPDEAVIYYKKDPVMSDGPVNHCYSLAGKGLPVIEMSPMQGDVSVFTRDRKAAGPGHVLYALHWPEDNNLLHFLVFMGRLFLWPPHKLMAGVRARELPGWKKRKT